MWAHANISCDLDLSGLDRNTIINLVAVLIFPKSPHRREGLAPRCRLFATWSCRWFQGLGCSPINAVRELGSERRETVRSISGVGVRALRGPFPSTRGPGRTHLWCTSYRAYGKRWLAKCGEDNC
uniref:Uncharacterized protein n=1 Tax=Avena sativa TaxID=4498 RepID=A0ACD6AXK2_AVESA